MKPHQERVVAEKAEVDAGLDKLRAFIGSDTFQHIDASERERLRRQAYIMKELSQVLGERIKAF